MKRALTYLALTFLVAPITLAACQPAAPAESVKIGALISLTGALLQEGPNVRKGLELALEHYGGEVAGKKIELIMEDDASDPTIALDKTRKLVERDKVAIVMVPLYAAAGQAVMPYLTEKKVIGIKQGQFPAPLTARFPYLFVPSGHNRQVTTPMGDYAYNVLKYRKISVMGPDYVSGKDYLGGFIDRFKQLGGAITQEQWFPVGAMDFASYLTNLKEADAVAAWVAGPGGPRLLKQYAEYGFYPRIPMVTPFSSGILNEDLLPQIGDIAVGIPGAVSYASTIDNPLNKKVVAEWKKKYNERPPYTAINSGYIDIQVAVEALKATKGDTDPDKLKDAILKLTLDTPAGPVRFTPDRQGIYNDYIVKVVKEGGEYFWQVVETYKDVTP